MRRQRRVDRDYRPVSARKVSRGAERRGPRNPRPPICRSYHMLGRMPSPPRDRPKPTTPEEEGIEFHPDAWERLEKAARHIAKAPPVHRTGKITGVDRPQRKRRGPAADKTSG